MRSWVFITLLAAAVVLSGCSSGVSVQKPAPEQQPEATLALALDELTSAAAPGATGAVDFSTTQVLGKAVEVVKSLALPEAEVKNLEFRIQDPDFIFLCAYSPGKKVGEVQLLGCRFGKYYNTVAGHTLFWKATDQWKGSYYPQAEEVAARSRKEYFTSLGENCPYGCAGGFKVLRQEGNRMLAVVDLSSVAAHGTDEVHLLERDQGNDTWRVIWVPTPDAYRFQGWPKVTLPEQGIGQFTVTYYDGSQAVWALEDNKFTRK